MVDADLLSTAVPGVWTRTSVLSGLIAGDDVQRWRYADHGPPPGTPEMRMPWGDVGYPVGWIVARPARQGSEGLVSHELIWSDGKTATLGGIPGNMVTAAATDTRTPAYADLPADIARARRTADAIAAGAAQALKADLYVTERPYLHAARWTLADGVTFCTPAEALALVSLYLRSKGIFMIWQGHDGQGGETFNKGLFYWVGSRGLLPEGGDGSMPASSMITHAGRTNSHISVVPSSSG
jgi:hypothetical protein